MFNSVQLEDRFKEALFVSMFFSVPGLVRDQGFYRFSFGTDIGFGLNFQFIKRHFKICYSKR